MTAITAAEGSASGHDIDNVFANGAVAASLETGGDRTRNGTSASEAAPRMRGAATDRQPPAPPAQPLVNPAAAASGRATDTAQAATLSFASDIGGSRTGGRETETAGGRMPMIRGQDDAPPLAPDRGARDAGRSAGCDTCEKPRCLLPSSPLSWTGPAGEGADRGADPDAPRRRRDTRYQRERHQFPDPRHAAPNPICRKPSPCRSRPRSRRAGRA